MWRQETDGPPQEGGKENPQDGSEAWSQNTAKKNAKNQEAMIEQEDKGLQKKGL